MSAHNPEFQIELVKLLLGVAWADHRMVRPEADMIRDLARKLGLDDAGRAQVESWLASPNNLPKPNLALLKPNKRAVLAAVRTLVLVDNRVAPEEEKMAAEIEVAFG